MDKIKKQHSDIIYTETFYDERKYEIGGIDNAAIKSAEITRKVSIDFFNWVYMMINRHEIIDKNNGSFYYKERYYISDELFNEFLKNT